MAMLGLFRLKSTSSTATHGCWRSFTSEGISFGREKSDLPEESVDAMFIDNSTVEGFLAQMEDDGRLIRKSGVKLLPWSDIFGLQDDPEWPGVREMLRLPNGADHVPSLLSIGSLRDRDFGIVVQAWRRPKTGRTSRVETCGAIIVDEDTLWSMSKKTWELIDQVSSFQDRPADEHDEASNRRQWGRIRRSAIAAGAHLDGFLLNAIVLTPEKLQVGLRKDETGGSKVVEVIPQFEGAPESWLEAFDTHGSVLDRYNIPTTGGVVAIEIDANVKTVLENIKVMPGRRVAGARAEAFLINPFAALGESAVETIDEAQFMEAREDAGLLFQNFSAEIERDAVGYPVSVALRIETPTTSGSFESEVRPFEDDEELKSFVDAVQTKLATGLQLCAWEGYDFELMGNTERELSLLREALEARTKPQVLVSYASIFDLSAYSERIEDIGEEKPFYSPYIAKKDDGEEWFPENIVPVISWVAEGSKEAVAVPVTPEVKDQIAAKIKEAEEKGETTFTLKGFDKPIPVEEAKSILKTFAAVEKQVSKGSFDPTKPAEGGVPKPNKHLVIKANIQSIDYEEARRDILRVERDAPALPSGLRSSVKLKEHQVSGFAWMQHLFSKAPNHCRGAVLADDMGLGRLCKYSRSLHGCSNGTHPCRRR